MRPNYIPEGMYGDCIPQCLNCFETSSRCYCEHPRWSVCYSDIHKAKVKLIANVKAAYKQMEEKMDVEKIKKEVLSEWTGPKQQTAQYIQDLEYQRWWLHQKWLKETGQFLRNQLSVKHYWNEIGAFIFTGSRRQGKTELLCKIVKELIDNNEKVIILIPYSNHTWVLQKRLGKDSYKYIVSSTTEEIWLPGIQKEQTHLFIDELIDDRPHLDDIFKYNWKSISIFKSGV